MCKKLYIIRHGYDVDGGFGDAIWREDVVGIVSATRQEIDEFIKKFDKPAIYDIPYSELFCHTLYADEVSLSTMEELYSKPYGKFDEYYDINEENLEYVEDEDDDS